MSREAHAHVQSEQLEQATKAATDLVRSQFEDLEAWVRLLVTEGTGNNTIYHFDAYGSSRGEQSRVIVQCAQTGHWVATRVGEPPVVSG